MRCLDEEDEVLVDAVDGILHLCLLALFEDLYEVLLGNVTVLFVLLLVFEPFTEVLDPVEQA